MDKIKKTWLEWSKSIFERELNQNFKTWQIRNIKFSNKDPLRLYNIATFKKQNFGIKPSMPL